MAYQVLARKYRPQKFTDVVGQDHVTRTLANAIRQKRIAHAYLFVGPRGTGKTTLARIFAKSLNCTGGPSVDFDDADIRCQEIVEGRSLDVIEIDGASNRGIEEIRELRETVKYMPAVSKHKIYIIDEVHMLTKEAFNALLKTLEEPPEHVKFLFATTEPEKILPTILSRCQRFDLRRIPAPLIVKHLAHIASLEGVSIDPHALEAVARGADGCMRDAESALDQLISFCGNKIVEGDVLSMFGLTAQTQLASLAEAILNSDAEGALRQLNEIATSGKDLGRLLSDLLSHFRNLLIYRLGKGDLTLLELTEVEAAILPAQSKKADSEAFTRIMEIFSDCEQCLREAASKKILFEVTLLKAIRALEATPIVKVLEQLKTLRKEAGRTTPSPSVVPPPASEPPQEPAEVIPASKRPTSQASEGPLLAPAPGEQPALPALWSKLMDAVGRVSNFTRTYLVQAAPLSLQDDLLTIGVAPQFADHLALLDSAKNRVLLQTKLSELGFPNLQVRFLVAEADTSGTTQLDPVAAGSGPDSGREGERKPVAFSEDTFKNDPIIQKALQLFNGHIVEVRA